MATPATPRLGELERAVLEVLWVAPPGTDLSVRQVHAQLGREIAYTTVMTVLDRLARKDLVLRAKDGKAYRYRARSSRAGLTAELMHGTLDDLTADDRGHALVAFVDVATPDDLASLRAALDRLGG